MRSDLGCSPASAIRARTHRSVHAEREHLQEPRGGGERSLASSFESRSHRLDSIAERWRSATEFRLSSIMKYYVRQFAGNIIHKRRRMISYALHGHPAILDPGRQSGVAPLPR